MGVDKPDIRTIVHTHLPGSVEAYLQESGRAGRDGKAARAILLFDAAAEEARRRWMTDERARVRFERMLSYVQCRDTCRRAVLLSLIGQDPVACSGCDVCDGAADGQAEGEARILRFTRRYRRRFTPAEAAEILCGARSPRAARGFHDCLPGAGALEGWTLEEAEEALGALTGCGKIRLLRRGPWRGRLHVAPAP
jgi:ATP-dependent DNA helicase RecQ